MQRFLASNPGLASRFPKTLTFADYDDDELFAIFALIADQQGFVLGRRASRSAVRVLIPRRGRPASATAGSSATCSRRRCRSRPSGWSILTDPTPEAIRTLLPEDLPTRAPARPAAAPGHVPVALSLPAGLR